MTEKTTAQIEVLGRRIHEIYAKPSDHNAKPSDHDAKPSDHKVGRLLYLHSAMGEATWQTPHLNALAERVELFAPAHPGFLSSEGLDEIRDVEDLVYHYLAYLDAKGWDSVAVMGVSLGGWIAAELAARYPERVSKLVLVSSVGIWLREKPIADLFAIDGRHPEKLRELLFHDQTSPFAQALGVELENLPDEIVVNFMNAMTATAKIGWNPLLHDPRLEALLPRITAETLVLWGANDRVVPLEYGEAFAKRIPHARLEIVRNCGHMLPLEQLDRFLEITTPFISS
jgi:pimeloyl-ACP methyl ester carboxylesterase